VNVGPRVLGIMICSLNFIEDIAPIVFTCLSVTVPFTVSQVYVYGILHTDFLHVEIEKSSVL
jgi:hypothetical protein